ncbi:MAG: histidine kinase dimerization/phospho-acceptor domain-containing protein, partial [Pikeienuella sp.]
MTLSANLWSILPLPALVIGADDHILEANTAAEAFLSTSNAHLRDKPIAHLFGEGSRAQQLLTRTRDRGINAADNNVEFLWPKRPMAMIDLLTAIEEGNDEVLLVLQPRSIAEQIDRSLTHRHAARSMIGMASMLAHEIKNPLAGISGAAQLLSMNLPAEDLELTDLIVEESRRIVKLL